MTPSEQLSFVEKLAFNDDVHIECKEKAKMKVKECRERLSNLEGRETVLERQVSLAEEALPDAQLEFPQRLTPFLSNHPALSEASSDEVAKFLINGCEEMTASLKERLQELENELNSVSEVEKKETVSRDMLNRLNIEISQLTDIRSGLGEILSDDQIREKEERLEELKERLDTRKKHEKYKKFSKEAEEAKESYLEELERKIRELENDLPSDTQELQEELVSLQEQREEYERTAGERQLSEKSIEDAKKDIESVFKRCRKFFDKRVSKIKKEATLLRFLEKEHDKLTKEEDRLTGTLEDKKSVLDKGIRYQCPSCMTALFIEDAELVQAEDDDVDLEELEEEYDKLELELSELELRKQCVERWENVLRASIEVLSSETPDAVVYDRERVEELQRIVLEAEFSQKGIEDLRESMDNLPSRISSLFDRAKRYSKYASNCDVSVEELRESIDAVVSEIEENWNSKSEHACLSRSINAKQKEIVQLNKILGTKRKLSKTKKGRTSEDILYDKETVQMGLVSAAENLTLASRYDNHQKLIQNLNNLRMELEGVVIERRRAEVSLRGALGLELCCVEAEILAMDKTIQSINEHARGYLEQMFDIPVSVKLHGRKTTQKGVTKTQMNTVIRIRGEETERNDLCGGEAQKIEIAFLLAVNDMVGSRILMLDECLNNLDAEVNTEVLTYLRRMAEDKMILVVSHEAIDGIFDNIVKL